MIDNDYQQMLASAYKFHHFATQNVSRRVAIALMRDDVMMFLVTSKRVLVVMFRGEFEKKYGRDQT